MARSKYDFVIGSIDSYGAIHIQAYSCDNRKILYHGTLWPTFKKRFRFDLRQWDFQQSPLSEMRISEEEAQDVIARIRRKFTPPFWILEGELWEKFDRCRDGDPKCKSYEKALKRLRKSYERKQDTN